MGATVFERVSGSPILNAAWQTANPVSALGYWGFVALVTRPFDRGLIRSPERALASMLTTAFFSFALALFPAFYHMSKVVPSRQGVSGRDLNEHKATAKFGGLTAGTLASFIAPIFFLKSDRSFVLSSAVVSIATTFGVTWGLEQAVG